MTELRGNVDVLAKTGAFHLRKDPFYAGLFLSAKSGLLKKRSCALVIGDDIAT